MNISDIKNNLGSFYANWSGIKFMVIGDVAKAFAETDVEKQRDALVGVKYICIATDQVTFQRLESKESSRFVTDVNGERYAVFGNLGGEGAILVYAIRPRDGVLPTFHGVPYDVEDTRGTVKAPN